MSGLIFRLFTPDDDIIALNALLRAAYAPLAASGLRYAASHEDTEATRKNVSEGECHLAFLDERLVGCVVLRVPGRENSTSAFSDKPEWYRRPGHTSFGRFAVDPLLQGLGYGAQILDHVEKRALELGFKELALDTSEKAEHLIALYSKRGYRFVGHHQWAITNYRSVLLSKTL